MAETLKIKDLPLDSRPREAFMRSAEPEREIPDASLLAILNHPSGDPTPSDEDIAETKRLRETGEVVGIPLDDHVVIGRDGSHVSIMASFAANGEGNLV